MGRTAPLTSKLCILYIYSTNIGTEYFKHGIYSPFLPLQNAVRFIILTYLVPVLFTFNIQDVLKFKKKFLHQKVNRGCRVFSMRQDMNLQLQGDAGEKVYILEGNNIGHCEKGQCI